MIFHTAADVPDSPRKIIQQGVRDYLTVVYNDEVPQMAEGDLQHLFRRSSQQSHEVLFAQVDASSIPNRGAIW